jgi:hypothetical protein
MRTRAEASVAVAILTSGFWVVDRHGSAKFPEN